MKLSKLITTFRQAYLLAHHAHHSASGPTFLQDHEFLGSLYSAYESAYDTLVERAIGLGSPVNEILVNKEAVAAYADCCRDCKTTDDFLKEIGDVEDTIRAEVTKCVRTASDGTANLLQGLADDSEARTYKLAQRLSV